MHCSWANAGFPHRRGESFFQCGLGHCLHAHAVRAESLAPPRTRTTARHCLAAQQSVTTARETCCKTGPAMPRASRRAQRLRRGATLAHASAVTTKWRTAGRLSHALRRACLARVLQNTRQRWCRLAATNRRQEGWPVSGPRVRRHCCARASPCRRGELLRGRGTSTHAPWPTRRTSFGSTTPTPPPWRLPPRTVRHAVGSCPIHEDTTSPRCHTPPILRGHRGGVVSGPLGNYSAAVSTLPMNRWPCGGVAAGPRVVRSKTTPPRRPFSALNVGGTAG